MKLLLVTFSDNADHQDTLFGMYEELGKVKGVDPYLLTIKTPKVPVEKSDHTWLVDCPKRPGITRKTFDFFLLGTIVRRVKKECFDVIWFESLHMWNLPILMAVRGKANTYHVIHDVVPHLGDRQAKQVEVFNKWIVRLADTIVLRNKTYVSAMIEKYQISPERVKYLELWRRYSEYTEPKHTRHVLFFGRINPYKGADNLLQIVRLCPEVQFDVVGKVDPTMEEIVGQLRKEKNVRLKTGYVSDKEMQKAFINADWVIAPYKSASQSGIIIDSYKYSRPVIAFTVGAIAEQVKNGRSGFLVQAGDVQEFAGNVIRAVNLSQKEYDEMSQFAYAYGNHKYGVSGAVNGFIRLICGAQESRSNHTFLSMEGEISDDYYQDAV